MNDIFGTRAQGKNVASSRGVEGLVHTVGKRIVGVWIDTVIGGTLRRWTDRKNGSILLFRLRSAVGPNSLGPGTLSDNGG